MSLIRRDATRDLEQFFDRFNRLFNENVGLTGLSKEAMTFADWMPAVDIQETVETYLVNAELPDVKKEDVHLSVQNGVLSLTGERRKEKEEKGKKFHRVERSYGRFERSFTLPDSIDTKNISASFKDGMLQVVLPKAPPTKNGSHEIKIG